MVIVNWTLRSKLQWNFNQNTKLFIHENASENVVFEKAAILSRGDELTKSSPQASIYMHAGMESYTFFFNYAFVINTRNYKTQPSAVPFTNMD